MHPQRNGSFVRIGRSPGLLGKVVAGMLALGVFALTLMFSMAVLAIALIGGAIAWGYLWWKTRALRRQLREQGSMPQAMFRPRAANDAQGQNDGIVLEGEVIREVPEEDARR